MANSAVEPDFDLKKRLVGAFVLIGFGVVILPALLGGNGPQFDGDDSTAAPRLDSKVFVSKITPIGGATPQRIPAAVETGIDQPVVEKPAPAPVTVAPADTGTSSKQAALSQGTKKATPKPKPKPKPKPVPAAGTGEPGWVVRIGTFAKQGNVDRVVKRLQQAGFDPSTTGIKTQQSSVTRVWIGPYAKRVEAARMRTRVQQVTGSAGYIAAYP